jgi:SAM-dependent methyltransferase
VSMNLISPEIAEKRNHNEIDENSMPGFAERWLYRALRLETLRIRLCQLRWRLLKHKLRFYPSLDEAVGEKAISHNISAFDHSAAFGMARRMSLLLYPTAAVFKDRLNDIKVLIVGPRTEDDIFWARSLGMFNTVGLDLFSYSPLIELGDIHDSQIPSESYDAVLLGWMISYSGNPRKVVDECLRILKPGGLLGIGIESNARQKYDGIQPPRMNALNSPADLADLTQLPIVFSNDPLQDITYDCGVIFKKPPRTAAVDM